MNRAHQDHFDETGHEETRRSTDSDILTGDGELADEIQETTWEWNGERWRRVA